MPQPVKMSWNLWQQMHLATGFNSAAKHPRHCIALSCRVEQHLETALGACWLNSGKVRDTSDRFSSLVRLRTVRRYPYEIDSVDQTSDEQTFRLLSIPRDSIDLVRNIWNLPMIWRTFRKFAYSGKANRSLGSSGPSTRA